MLTDRRTKLAIKNGKQEEVYKQETICEIRTQYPSLNEELAVLRKEIALLRKILIEELKINISSSEFDDYNNHVESSKTKAKKRIKK